MTINFSISKDIDIKQLEELYNDVGWSAYTQDLEVLKQAILQSLDVITVWNDDKLVGLIRAIGDGLTIVYIQDILVLNAYQNKGIASELLQRILNKYKNDLLRGKWEVVYKNKPYSIKKKCLEIAFPDVPFTTTQTTL